MRIVTSLVPAAAALLAGCMAASSPLPGTTPTVPLATTPAAATPDQAAALSELCDPEHGAGLANLATQLKTADHDDPRLSANIAAATANLAVQPLGPDEISVRDSAVGLMSDVAAGIDDPDVRATTAAAAANMLRNLEAKICPPPDR